MNLVIAFSKFSSQIQEQKGGSDSLPASTPNDCERELFEIAALVIAFSKLGSQLLEKNCRADPCTSLSASKPAPNSAKRP